MKRRKWRAALTALLLLAAVGGLLWCFFPRSMMEGELYCVTLWDGQARVDLKMCIRDSGYPVLFRLREAGIFPGRVV